MSRRRIQHRGFTLIEIMIVVAIMGVILAMGLPSLIHSARKEGMRKAVSDMTDACGNARARAILSGVPTELVIHPKQGSFEVVSMPMDSMALANGQGSMQGGQAPLPAKLPDAVSSQLPGNVGIKLLGVDNIEYQDEDEARVRFYPNGMSSEFTIILVSDQQEWRQIKLEAVTALADVTAIR